MYTYEAHGMSSHSHAVICDFDGTLYNKGPISHVVNYLFFMQKNYDIIIVTSRRYGNGIGQVQRLLYDAHIKPAAIFPGVGHDTPVLKSAVAKKILTKKPVFIAIDNNPEVVLEYKALGINAVTPDRLGGPWQLK